MNKTAFNYERRFYLFFSPSGIFNFLDHRLASVVTIIKNDTLIYI